MKKQTTSVLSSLAILATVPTLAIAGPRSYAQLGEECLQRFDSASQSYMDIPSLWKRSDKCQPGTIVDSSTGESYQLTCHVALNDTGMDPRNGSIDIAGTCVKSTCVSGTGGNGEMETSQTEQVTICHRTDSDLNPWVRLTIDRQTWFDETNSCGFTTEDFIVKEHGTRAAIADAMNKGQITEFPSEKEYWKYWDRPCPSVRQDPNHPHSCCSGNDCCEEFLQLQHPEETEQAASSPDSVPEAQFSRLAQEETDPDCPAEPTENFSQDIYVTFMGEAGKEGASLSSHLTDLGLSLSSLQDEIKSVYNTKGGDGDCVYFQRKIASVTFDDIATPTLAMNKNYDLVGFRVRATVSGTCEGCTTHKFLPSDRCRETMDSSCSTCTTLSDRKVIQIAGKDLYPDVNSNLALAQTSVEIFRIQGDVLPETPCAVDEVKYLEATGEVVCL